MILKCQKMLFASYRRDQFDDPDSYLTMLGTVLEQYADDVVMFVCDPRTGLQRKSKWPPTISEVVEACDARAAWLARVDRFRNWGKKTDAPLQLEQPRETRPTREALQAKYGPTYGIDADGGESSKAAPSRAPSAEQLRQHYAAHALGFQQRAAEQ